MAILEERQLARSSRPTPYVRTLNGQCAGRQDIIQPFKIERICINFSFSPCTLPLLELLESGDGSRRRLMSRSHSSAMRGESRLLIRSIGCEYDSRVHASIMSSRQKSEIGEVASANSPEIETPHSTSVRRKSSCKGPQTAKPARDSLRDSRQNRAAS